MQFVNLTGGLVYTPLTGNLKAGKITSGKCESDRDLEKVLDNIVSTCGSKLGIRLNSREAELLNKLMELDEKGGGFDPASLPAPRKIEDPGVRAQRARLEAVAAANEKAARREAEINGETLPERKPVGPATLAGEGIKIDPGSPIKSGFDAIMEANAKLEQEKKPMDPKEALDPIGAHAAKPDPDADAGDQPEQEEPESIGKDPEPVPEASGRDDDATKSADTEIPEAEPAGNGRMDKQAAEMAKKLSKVGPEAKKGRSRKAK